MPDEERIPAEPDLATPETAQAQASAKASEPSAPLPHEEPAPMLDVHPAHHAASTWRDFFIHIATIVLGLIIAVGLEQTVEYIHHRHQAREARKNIQDEIRANLDILQDNQKDLARSRKQ